MARARQQTTALAVLGTVTVAGVLASSSSIAPASATAVERYFGGAGMKAPAPTMPPIKTGPMATPNIVKKVGSYGGYGYGSKGNKGGPYVGYGSHSYGKNQNKAKKYKAPRPKSKTACSNKLCYNFSSESECSAHGCCWDANKYACLQTVQSTECQVNDNAKVACGWPGITYDECKYYNCCYVPGAYSNYAPWCYYKANAKKPVQIHYPEPVCNVKDKIPCRAVGKKQLVSEEECTAANCCFQQDVYQNSGYGYGYGYGYGGGGGGGGKKMTASQFYTGVGQGANKKGGSGSVYRHAKKQKTSGGGYSAGVTNVKTNGGKGKKSKNGFCYEPLGKCQVAYGNRKDCGHPGITALTCYKKGCCFNPVHAFGDQSQKQVSKIPWCFYKQTVFECKAHGETPCGYECCGPNQECIKSERDSYLKGPKQHGGYVKKKNKSGGKFSKGTYHWSGSANSISNTGTSKTNNLPTMSPAPTNVKTDKYGFPLGTDCQCKYATCGYQEVPLWYGYKKLNCCAAGEQCVSGKCVGASPSPSPSV